ncbi:hypothetical protein [Sphingomonas sp.]|uniref:hypothetical protein n=1 Tax=Sphingomonas sp. TaxID=28214 RepID=UPI003BAB5461
MSLAPQMDAAAPEVRILSAELSPRPRVAHALLLAAALGGTVVTLSLFITEPDLPLRTRAALAVLSLIGMGWTGYALWVLTQRRVLYARQQVVAGWMAVAFTSVFSLGALAIGIGSGMPVGFVAAAMGVAMIGAALVVLSRARRRLATLTAKRRALETQLAEGAR